MDRTMDEVFEEWDEWSGGVHQGLGMYDEVRRYVDIQKPYECVGLRREVMGKAGKGWDN